jgi:hypothetical protein
MYVRYSPSNGAFGINGPASTQRHRYWYTDNGRLDYVVGMFEKVSDLCDALHMKLGSLSTSVDAVEVFVRGRNGEYVAAAKKRLCKEAIPSAASLPPRVPGASPLRITYLPPEALSPQGSRRHPLTSRMVGDAGLAADTSISASHAGGATESLSDTVAAAFRGSTMAAGRAAKNNFYGRQHKVPLDYAAPRIARILESVGDALERHHPKTIAVGDTPQWVVVDIPLPLDDGESKRPRGITIPAVSKSGADSVEAVKAHLHRHLAPAAAVPISIFFFDRQLFEWTPLTNSTVRWHSPVFVVETRSQRSISARFVPARPPNAVHKAPGGAGHLAEVAEGIEKIWRCRTDAEKKHKSRIVKLVRELQLSKAEVRK